MATPKQVELYNSLCEELGQEPDEEFENLSYEDSYEAIQELIQIRDSLRTNDDEPYWY